MKNRTHRRSNKRNAAADVYQKTLSHMVVGRLKSWISTLNALGVPLPMVRDPKTSSGSATLTMTILSFNTCLLGQIGKIGNLLGNVDLSQANYLFLMCLGAYLGRRMQKSGQPPAQEERKEPGCDK
jgi:F0F1-type ATP synthase membrane subunit a